MKTSSNDAQECAQQLWRELDGLDWSSHELAIIGILRDALESCFRDGQQCAEVPVKILKDGSTRALSAKEVNSWRKRMKTKIHEPRGIEKELMDWANDPDSSANRITYAELIVALNELLESPMDHEVRARCRALVSGGTK